ncbi:MULTISPECIES: macro domain-containing protein [unclassified Bradyrhizobium]|uniref:macro domain-containing protein n=1 Tax=unclassified Bradyrhizobium TaxID=2631580 RepID=UPI0028E222A9|nr:MULTISPECIES: macro domain-containing protein [unclassified Bradyrhizobium]
MLTVHLRDISIEVIEAWRSAFAGVGEVQVSHGSILEQQADAIVSPANSFGFMDGGIDLHYARFFGWQVETELRELLAAQHYGELPVGQAVILPTGHPELRYLVCAPTMRVPSRIDGTPNVYLAFRAALIAVQAHNTSEAGPITSLLAPGMGTGIGAVPPRQAARQMRAAYDAIVGGHGRRSRTARAILGEHHDLLA